MTPDRRTFLRNAILVGFAAPLGGLLACRLEAPDGDEGKPDSEAATGGDVLPLASADRPTVLAFTEDAVHLVAPQPQRPLAYLSRAEARVYVDPAERDHARRILDAYISVSTGLWRIRRPGDDPRTPITPDDEAREFEERELWEWDPGTAPGEGDVRVLRGSAVTVDLPATCAPVQPAAGWVALESAAVQRMAGPGGEGGQEFFREVARGIRHPDRACSDAGVPVRVLSWAVGEAGPEA